MANNYDWTAPQNGDLWRDDIKTLFDPCPAGWRVPKNGIGDSAVWQAFGNESLEYINGAWVAGPEGQTGSSWATPAIYKGPAWYPANGCRVNSSGVFVVTDMIGHAWSSTIKDTHVLFLRFLSDEIRINFPIPRVYGFSVRCVRE